MIEQTRTIAGATVLVTGANRGIGKAFVQGLLQRGAAKVYAGVRDVDTVDTASIEGGDRVVPIRLDISDASSVAAAATSCADVTIVVNNAGITTGASLLTGDLDDIRRDLDVNFFGSLGMTRAFAPVLEANGGGAFVNMLSALSWLSLPQTGAYCAAKAASLSMTNSLRVELAAQGTSVVAVHVGYVDTDMTAGISGPKTDPRDVVAGALDALEAGRAEVLVDDVSRHVRAALSGDLSALYPTVVAAGAVGPRAEASSLEQSSAFVAAAGLVLDDVSATHITGHVDVGEDHHTPWGIVHGGVYATAIESAASIGATTAVQAQGMVAVGLTNTTHFLRSITKGRADVTAVALNQGRTQQLWQVDVKDDRGRLLAHGEVRLQNVAGT
jgi:uncharacterized protein (TIGR00369 family)